MFGRIRDRWREARGSVLRAEVEDSLLRLQGAEPEVSDRCIGTLVVADQALTKQFGSFVNIFIERKREIAKDLLRRARNLFDLDMGQGYGLALLSAHLEAQCLPGDDASFVAKVTSDLLETALDGMEANAEAAQGQARTNEEGGAGDADALAQKLIDFGKLFGAKTPREAAEMVQGRPLTDEEWERHKEAWQRNW